VTDRQTDGRTDGQTEFSSLYRVCITCSAVKMSHSLPTHTIPNFQDDGATDQCSAQHSTTDVPDPVSNSMLPGLNSSGKRGSGERTEDGYSVKLMNVMCGPHQGIGGAHSGLRRLW